MSKKGTTAWNLEPLCLTASKHIPSARRETLSRKIINRERKNKGINKKKKITPVVLTTKTCDNKGRRSSI